MFIKNKKIGLLIRFTNLVSIKTTFFEVNIKNINLYKGFHIALP